MDDLWIGNNGQVTCVEHGGGYLQAAVEDDPAATFHVTPLDLWEKATPGLYECEVSHG